MLACTIALAACGSGGLAPPGDTSHAQAPGPIQETKPAKEDLPTAVSTHADGEAPFTFVLARDEAGARLRILSRPEDEKIPAAPVLKTDGTPVEYKLAFRDREGRIALNPTAVLAVQDGETPSTQRLYILFKGDPVAGRVPSLGEAAVQMDRIASGGNALTIGRVFIVPVHGSLAGATLGRTPDRRTLTVNVPAPAGDPSQPMLLLYDIRPESPDPNPVDIRMVPQSGGANPATPAAP